MDEIKVNEPTEFVYADDETFNASLPKLKSPIEFDCNGPMDSGSVLEKPCPVQDRTNGISETNSIAANNDEAINSLQNTLNEVELPPPIVPVVPETKQSSNHKRKVCFLNKFTND